MTTTIPLSHTPIDHAALAAVLERYTGRGHQDIIRDFEVVLAGYSGMEAVAVSSGTAAIHLGLIALGVGQGDVVIIPTFTYIATVNPVLYLGAEPVFVDC